MKSFFHNSVDVLNATEGVLYKSRHMDQQNGNGEPRNKTQKPAVNSSLIKEARGIGKVGQPHTENIN